MTALVLIYRLLLQEFILTVQNSRATKSIGRKWGEIYTAYNFYFPSFPSIDGVNRLLF